ncbi:S41 family peptidase [Novosphingobium sp.]|uniref:S41 family peptidase n=1 Tax=Novosphingobium sp. TaxID=1874826 RepID=UPI0025FF99B6|nr:S41 family peptidase [Novosphingobium sp.]
MIDRRSVLRTGSAALVAGGTALYTDPLRSAQPALDDPTVVRRALALHPGLYRYQSPRQFAQRFDRFAAEWGARPALSDRFLALSRLTAAVRCGHTQCNPYNQVKTVAGALLDRPTRLPFAFAWIDGHMVVLGDSGAATGIARGSIVEQINGRRPEAMLRALLPYARADGSNDGKRVAQMEMRGTDEHETFDIFQGLLFPPDAGGHKIVWRDPAGQRRTALLPAVATSARNALLAKPKEDGVLWDWRVGSDGVAVLTMPTWVTYRGNWDWQAWLAERFASLAGAKGLIIDLRDNEGGTDCGTFILQHLIPAPFRPLRYFSRVAFRETPADLRPYLDTWDPGFHTLGADGVPDARGNLIVDRADTEDILHPAGSRIGVPVAVLVGPVNSSATFSFARRIRESGAAKLVGSPTGGNMRGINGGAFFFVRLPETGLEFDLPIKGYYPEHPQADTGVLPHIAVSNTVQDIASGYDRVMVRAHQGIVAAR